MIEPKWSATDVSSDADLFEAKAALKAKYAEDGDWILPPFAKAFGFTEFNPSTREVDTPPNRRNCFATQ